MSDELQGVFTALVTPFRGEEVDRDALADLVDVQIEQGVHGLVPCGTTGESPTLSPEEHDQVVSFVVERAGGRVPVIAGAGSNSTREAVTHTRHARECGADAALVVLPYYNKPTPAGALGSPVFTSGRASTRSMSCFTPGSLISATTPPSSLSSASTE